MKHQDGWSHPRFSSVGITEAIASAVCIAHLQAQSPPPVPEGGILHIHVHNKQNNISANINISVILNYIWNQRNVLSSAFYTLHYTYIIKHINPKAGQHSYGSYQ